jgi:rhodanese-related sulfurtransferase
MAYAIVFYSAIATSFLAYTLSRLVELNIVSLTKHAQRGGHIPGAVNIPWIQAVNDSDGTLKSVQELKDLYESKGITPDKEIITYCRIGGRSSHTWFALTYALFNFFNLSFKIFVKKAEMYRSYSFQFCLIIILSSYIKSNYTVS